MSASLMTRVGLPSRFSSALARSNPSQASWPRLARRAHLAVADDAGEPHRDAVVRRQRRHQVGERLDDARRRRPDRRLDPDPVVEHLAFLVEHRGLEPGAPDVDGQGALPLPVPLRRFRHGSPSCQSAQVFSTHAASDTRPAGPPGPASPATRARRPRPCGTSGARSGAAEEVRQQRREIGLVADDGDGRVLRPPRQHRQHLADAPAGERRVGLRLPAPPRLRGQLRGPRRARERARAAPGRASGPGGPARARTGESASRPSRSAAARRRGSPGSPGARRSRGG